MLKNLFPKKDETTPKCLPRQEKPDSLAPMPFLHTLLAQHVPTLEAAGLYNPQAEMLTLASYVLEKSKDELRQNPKQEISDKDALVIGEAVTKRTQRTPLARIFGYSFFRGLRFEMAEGVFEPFSDTETLIDYAHKAAEGMKRPLRVLDLGTGCGAVLLSLLHELPHSSGVGIDSNRTALTLAEKNARNHGLSGRTVFRHGDWLDGIDETFDIILASPPMVPSAHTSKLMPEVQHHDPIAALDGGKDGTLFYARTLDRLNSCLKETGAALLQTNPAILPQTLRLFRHYGYAPDIGENYLGLPACLIARLNKRKQHGLLNRITEWMRL